MRSITKWPIANIYFYLNLSNETKFTDRDQLIWVCNDSHLPMDLRCPVSKYNLENGQTVFISTGEAIEKFLLHFFLRYRLLLPTTPQLIDNLEIKILDEKSNHSLYETAHDMPPAEPKADSPPLDIEIYKSQLTWYSAKMHLSVLEAFFRHRSCARNELPPQIVDQYVYHKLQVASALIELFNCRTTEEKRRKTPVIDKSLKKFRSTSSNLLTWGDYLDFCGKAFSEFKKATSPSFFNFINRRSPDKIKLYHCLLNLFPDFEIRKQLSSIPTIDIPGIHDLIMDYIAYQIHGEDQILNYCIKK